MKPKATPEAITLPPLRIQRAAIKQSRLAKSRRGRKAR